MTPREQLDVYALERDCEPPMRFKPSRVLFAPKAFAALRAVLDLHVPDPAVRARKMCKHCVAVPYPCPTVQAITTALEAT